MCKYLYNGKWYTEEELLSLPEFNSMTNISPLIERGHIINNTGENTDAQIFYSPRITQAGIFTKFLQFKKGQMYELNRRLNKIEALKKRKGITTEELTKLNNLEREIKLHVEGNFELGIKGLKGEIADLEKEADILSVGYYIEKDLQRLDKITKTSDLDDVREAQKIIDFYDLAGTFKRNVDNPFFTQEEIFLEDENGNLTSEYRLSDETMNKFRDWRTKAMYYQNIIDKVKEEITVGTINDNPSVRKTYGKDKQFSFDEITNADTGLKDTDWISMWTMDITNGIFSKNGILPQVMFSYLTNSFEKKLAWARKVEEKIDKMSPGVRKELVKLGYSLRGGGIIGLKGASYQIFKEITKEGNETGGLIQRFVKEFFDEQSRVMNKFRTKFDEAKTYIDFATRARMFNKVFEDLKKWRRSNTIIMDINKVPELLATTTPEADAYKTYLTSVLGEKGYNEQVEKQKGLLNKYESEKQSMIDTLLIMEGKATFADLSDKAKSDLAYWENNHDPKRGIEDYNSVNGIFFGDRKANNFMDYNNFIPRKFVPNITVDTSTNQYLFEDTANLTGHYNTTFETIENNPVLSEFYDTIREVCETIRENMPYELQQKMSVNTIPALAKTSAEIIADRNTGVLSSLFLGFKRIMERIRLSFGVTKQSEVSYAVLDPITGKANYKVNDTFLQGNTRAVKERMTIEKSKFMETYNTTMPKDHELTNITRFSVLLLSNLNAPSLMLLAEYLNIDISVDDIRAGKIDAIHKVTGDAVQIGKYIRDFSLHSVVQSQSFDLPKIGKYFANMIMGYAARQEALPILEIMKQHYESIQKPKTNNLGTGIYNANHDTFEMTGVRTNAIRQMDDWFERVALDNYGLKEAGVHGSENKEKVDDKGERTTKIPFYGKKIYSDEEKKKIKEINKLLSSKLDDDNKSKLAEIKSKFGKERTATALFDNFLSWVRTLRLGYNISSASTNFLEGVTSNMILASTGEYFDPKEIYYGYNVIKHSFIKNLTFGVAETGLARKNRKLMDKFNVIMDSKNELQKSSIKTYANKFSWLNPHELNQRVEYINQSPLMIAILRSTKIKDKEGNESSVWDAMNKDGHLRDEFKTEDNIKNWEDLAGDEYYTFKQKLNKVIVLGHGNYDELRGMMIKSSSAGKAVMMFKTWIPMQLYWRFATEQDDIQSGTIGYKGRYWSYNTGTGGVHGAAISTILFGPFGAIAGAALGGFLGNRFGTDSGVGLLQETLESTKQLAKKIIGTPVNLLAGKKIIGTGDKAFENWVGKGDFTEQDAKNMRGNMSDISIQLAWLALILAVKSIFWDDDDDPKDPNRIAHNILVNKLMTLSSQGAMYVNPVDAFRSTVGSMAVVQYCEDVGKEMTRVVEYINGRDIIQSGIHAGQSGLKLQTEKILMPGIFKGNMFGFGTQAERVFEESPFHPYFKGQETIEKEENKRDRAERRLELKDEGFDDKEIRKILDDELPTPTKLKKLNMTRDEYEKQREE